MFGDRDRRGLRNSSLSRRLRRLVGADDGIGAAQMREHEVALRHRAAAIRLQELLIEAQRLLQGVAACLIVAGFDQRRTHPLVVAGDFALRDAVAGRRLRQLLRHAQRATVGGECRRAGSGLAMLSIAQLPVAGRHLPQEPGIARGVLFEVFQVAQRVAMRESTRLVAKSATSNTDIARPNPSKRRSALAVRFRRRHSQ